MSVGTITAKLRRLDGEVKVFGWMVAVFALAYSLPLSNPQVTTAIQEAFRLLQWYVRNHTLACVVPAMFIAGAISTFLSQPAVLRHLGPRANKVTAYGVASVSGTILAVCSCSVLPMFAGIYKLGAGLGPAAAFLYAGPAINVLALFLTARVLGLPIGVGRGVGAVAFSIVIGLLMALIFRREDQHRNGPPPMLLAAAARPRPLWKNALFLGCMVAFLVFSDWWNPGNVVVRTTDGSRFAAVALQETKDEVLFQLQQDWNGQSSGEKVTLSKKTIAQMEEARTRVMSVYHARWYLAGAMGLAVLGMTWRWLARDEVTAWMTHTWDFAKMIVPLLFGGVFLTGFIGALLPDRVVAGLVGDNSLRSNLVASVIGAFWYFATLTEIPICEALGKLGMASGPMMALLLAGPALSLPSMLVLRRIMGLKKTLVFTSLVVVMGTFSGLLFGRLFP